MEGDAGTSRLIPDPETGSVDAALTAPEETPAAAAGDVTTEELTDSRRPARLGNGWAAAVCVLVVLLAAGVGVGGYLAHRANDRAEDIARADDAALAAAKECVAATQAPDTAAMAAAQTKILECSTGEFGVQAGLYSSVLAEAYQAADATVKVDDLRAAVERHNEDGTVNVLVAVRVRITNAQAADQQVGYRLRATMAYDEGRYRISKIDQVTS